MEELATKTTLPKVPTTLPARTIPVYNSDRAQVSIDLNGKPYFVEAPSRCLWWNSTIDELKESNSPANVGLCYQCDRDFNYYSETIGSFRTYPIALAPHIVVLELPNAMELTLSGHWFWDNGLGERGQFTKVSFPAKGQYVLQVRLRRDSDCSHQMITEDMRPYVKAIIFPMAEQDKMRGDPGLPMHTIKLVLD